MEKSLEGLREQSEEGTRAENNIKGGGQRPYCDRAILRTLGFIMFIMKPLNDFNDMTQTTMDWLGQKWRNRKKKRDYYCDPGERGWWLE